MWILVDEGLHPGESELESTCEMLWMLDCYWQTRMYNNAQSTPFLSALRAWRWEIKGKPGSLLSHVIVHGWDTPSVMKKVVFFVSKTDMWNSNHGLLKIISHLVNGVIKKSRSIEACWIWNCTLSAFWVICVQMPGVNPSTSNCTGLILHCKMWANCGEIKSSELPISKNTENWWPREEPWRRNKPDGAGAPFCLSSTSLLLIFH